MFKKIYNLLKILRKLSVSGAIETLDEIRPIPKSLKFIFAIFSIGSSKKIENLKKSSGEKLCQSLEDMGTTFIKLGQFLATRPDIIGEEIAKKLEKLQDKLPAFGTEKAKNIIKKEIGTESLKYFIFKRTSCSSFYSTSSFCKNKIDNSEKELAIKILRPNIHSIFNEELDALMFLAYLIENVFKNQKIKISGSY